MLLHVQLDKKKNKTPRGKKSKHCRNEIHGRLGVVQETSQSQPPGLDHPDTTTNNEGKMKSPRKNKEATFHQDRKEEKWTGVATRGRKTGALKCTSPALASQKKGKKDSP